MQNQTDFSGFLSKLRYTASLCQVTSINKSVFIVQTKAKYKTKHQVFFQLCISIFIPACHYYITTKTVNHRFILITTIVFSCKKEPKKVMWQICLVCSSVHSKQCKGLALSQLEHLRFYNNRKYKQFPGCWRTMSGTRNAMQLSLALEYGFKNTQK